MNVETRAETTATAEIVAAIQSAGYRANPRQQSRRTERLLKFRETRPDAKIVVVRDEFTGHRFGKNHLGAVKLGHNSSTPHGNGSNCYQVWAV